MDYNNQNPYEQNSGTDPYGQNSGTNPYTQAQEPQGSAQQTTAGQGAYSQSPYQQNTYGQNSYQQSPYQQNPYQQSPYQQNPYQQNAYEQNNYQQNQSYQYGDMEEPMSVKEWLIVDLLMMIPCVNLILIFVWAFSSGEKKSKSNYFKANLIFAGCVLAFYLLLLIIAVGAGVFTAVSLY